MTPKSSTLGQGITIQYLGGPLGAILSHFGPYLGHFGVILAARARGWGQFVPISYLLSYSKLLEWPRFRCNGSHYTTWYQWEPLRAIFGHFGMIIAAKARGWGQFAANFISFRLFETAWMTTNQVQWARLWTHGTCGGLLLPFWAIFGLFQSDFSCQSKRLGPALSQFLTFSHLWMTTNQVQTMKTWY